MSEPTPIRPDMPIEISELDAAKAQSKYFENLLSLTRQQLSNVLLQIAQLDLELATLKSQPPQS